MVTDAANSYFEELDKSHSRDFLIKLEHQYDLMCIALSRDYVEKNKK